MYRQGLNATQCIIWEILSDQGLDTAHARKVEVPDEIEAEARKLVEWLRTQCDPEENEDAWVPAQLEIYAAGEESEVAAMTQGADVHKLHAWLEEWFQGDCGEGIPAPNIAVNFREGTMIITDDPALAKEFEESSGDPILGTDPDEPDMPPETWPEIVVMEWGNGVAQKMTLQRCQPCEDCGRITGVYFLAEHNEELVVHADHYPDEEMWELRIPLYPC